MGRSATGWTGPTAQPGAGADDAALACVIVNPSKPAVTADFRRRLARALRSAGYRGPVWLDTTVAEPGATQARLAVASGARLVIAVGGDGTVRAVAAGLAGTDVELGVVPLGTANLAARNLGLPVGGDGRLGGVDDDAGQGVAIGAGAGLRRRPRPFRRGSPHAPRLPALPRRGRSRRPRRNRARRDP